MSGSFKKYEFIEIEPGFYSIEQEYVRSFMFIDAQSILLVDLGMGGNQLLSQVREFSTLPIKVVITHADKDHIGDLADFGDCYMHPCEADYYGSKVEEPVKTNPIWEGDRIDIGVYHFEVVLIPGHTPGSIALLDRQKKIMIGGDTIQSGPIFMFGPGRNFHAYQASMNKLIGQIEDIEWVYACHHEMKVPSSMIYQLLNGAGEMIEGRVDGEPEARFDSKIKCYRVNGIAFFAL